MENEPIFCASNEREQASILIGEISGEVASTLADFKHEEIGPSEAALGVKRLMSMLLLF